MEYLKDVLAALSVILNGLPQGLLALSFGFASVPTALAFIVGAIGCLIFGVVAPVSFQAETITLAGTMGKNMKERISMIILGAIGMTIIGAFGLLERIVNFIGPAITSGMMAGVGIMLTRVAVDMARKNKIVGFSSIGISFVVYMLTKDLVYTIAISVIVSSIIALILKQESDIIISEREKFVFQKPIINIDVIRGALAMICLNIGANIAFGKITGNIANTNVNIDHLSIVSSLADLASAMFGGGPVESIISATGGSPHPLMSGVLMMVLMAIILFAGLLPKMGKYIPSESIAGFLFVLGAIVTVPVNAVSALTGTGIPGGPIVGGITMTVTAITDPFLGMVSGIIFKVFASILGM
ncbi:NCS2 family permease [Anaerosalibacter bizertensis]|uniref:NCS2 family permease n=1 Tax=Anaerosalibacter bizertensis TaxID=932217 RepID=UPI001C0F1817|nr:NCS2 family permease [Anaerosalibacter bizertensis]MBU5292701.1 NCS2 family permease [Anaerosalibacter bizertensis]